MFSCFLVTLGMLDEYDQGNLSGVEVDFGNTGYYYDPAYGPNWWEYYFLPLRTDSPNYAQRVQITDAQLFRFHDQGASILSRERCNELIQRYIPVRKEFLDDVDAFLEEQVNDKMLIGVHYRSTDKFYGEAQPITAETSCQKIQTILENLPEKDVKIFVATDDSHFLEQMKLMFGDKVIFFDMYRSTDNQPIHTTGAVDGFTKGKMALLDCLVLSRSNLLIRTSSNLSNVSMLFNPTLQVIRINDSRWWAER